MKRLCLREQRHLSRFLGPQCGTRSSPSSLLIACFQVPLIHTSLASDASLLPPREWARQPSLGGELGGGGEGGTENPEERQRGRVGGQPRPPPRGQRPPGQGRSLSCFCDATHMRLSPALSHQEESQAGGSGRNVTLMKGLVPHTQGSARPSRVFRSVPPDLRGL